MPGEPSLPDSESIRTTGSTVRPDDAASASLEKPALSLFPMSLTEALSLCRGHGSLQVL